MTEFIPHIGTDESGKGDFFGPLVIAGVLVDEKMHNTFLIWGLKTAKSCRIKNAYIVC